MPVPYLSAKSTGEELGKKTADQKIHPCITDPTPKCIEDTPTYNKIIAQKNCKTEFSYDQDLANCEKGFQRGFLKEINLKKKEMNEKLKRQKSPPRQGRQKEEQPDWYPSVSYTLKEILVKKRKVSDIDE